MYYGCGHCPFFIISFHKNRDEHNISRPQKQATRDSRIWVYWRGTLLFFLFCDIPLVCGRGRFYSLATALGELRLLQNINIASLGYGSRLFLKQILAGSYVPPLFLPALYMGGISNSELFSFSTIAPAQGIRRKFINYYIFSAFHKFHVSSHGEWTFTLRILSVSKKARGCIYHTASHHIHTFYILIIHTQWTCPGPP